MTIVDVKQVIFALERQARALDAQAERLLKRRDYSAEFPAEDADRMREAIALLQAKPVQPYAGVMQGIQNEVDAKQAARYRWLRDRSGGQWVNPIVVGQKRSERRMLYTGPITGKSLDAAIDAAMGAEAPVGRVADRPGDLVPLAGGGSVDLAGSWKLPT